VIINKLPVSCGVAWGMTDIKKATGRASGFSISSQINLALCQFIQKLPTIFSQFKRGTNHWGVKIHIFDHVAFAKNTFCAMGIALVHIIR